MELGKRVHKLKHKVLEQHTCCKVPVPEQCKCCTVLGQHMCCTVPEQSKLLEPELVQSKPLEPEPVSHSKVLEPERKQVPVEHKQLAPERSKLVQALGMLEHKRVPVKRKPEPEQHKSEQHKLEPHKPELEQHKPKLHSILVLELGGSVASEHMLG